MSERLDILLCARGLTASRTKAREEILNGHVTVAGKCVTKPGEKVPENAEICLSGEQLRYVSRGGLKLERALACFQVEPADRVALDCGASTGGFTDCLLQNGARHVYALDVGTDQLAASLRADPRVTVMEQFNARQLRPEDLGELPSLVTSDVSFISLRLILPALARVLTENGDLICLIKPQFEAGRERLGKNGVIRNPGVHREVLRELLAFFPEAGLYPAGLTWSPIRGPEGNLEYLCHLRKTESGFEPDPDAVVAACWEAVV